MYEKGKGVAKDPAEAAKWYRRAADRGGPWAQENLGRMYELGEGVAKDSVEAARWCRMAVRKYREKAEGGDNGAKRGLAWIQATCVVSEVRDGRNAVNYAEKAIVGTNRKNPEMLDTLAAACAEVGEFAKAVATQKEAVLLQHDEGTKKDYEARLKLYESNSPYRDR